MNVLLKDADAQIINEVLSGFGFRVYFVGGAVRDSLLGIAPKDIDLTTDATPQQMQRCFASDPRTRNVIETGISHGTLTVVINHTPYEITTFRIDTDTDGRHATVEYTTDIVEDLRRRDLTINAIAMDFKGELIDPFNGVGDLNLKLVRFVGNASDRLREDYLRILRWFRFYGRFAKEGVRPDGEAISAIRDTAPGLRKISVERIWAEVSKIMAGPNALDVLSLMSETGVSDIIGLSSGATVWMNTARQFTRDPAFIMACYLTGENVEDIGKRWKWSNQERKTARFVTERCPISPYGIVDAKRDIINGNDREMVTTMLAMRTDPSVVDQFKVWEVPTFPVTGNDLIAMGMTPGRYMGLRMNAMREMWIASDYTMGKADMLKA